RQRHVAAALPSPLIVGATFSDQALRFGMKRKPHAERLRGGLTGLVIRGCADPAAAEHDVAGREAARQRGGNGCAVVRNELRPAELHAPLGQQLYRLGEVFVLATAGQNLIANDDEPDLANISHVSEPWWWLRR